MYYYRKNLQGDITHIYTATGVLKAAYVYDAWGNQKIVYNSDNIANINPFRYRSYYFDTETGLYYLQSRYYDPEVGRFINMDDLNYIDPESFGGMNLFAYCLNNPVMGYDPTGCWDWGKFWAATVGALSGLALVGGIILSATGVAAPIGAVLIGVGAGGLLGTGGSIISQGLSDNGWDNINWGQVAFNGAIGMGTGALMASPLGAVATGFAVGGLGFTQSIGNDLFENDGDWGQVNWSKAIVLGVISGALAGGGKYLTKSVSLMNKFINSSSSVKTAAELSIQLGSAGRLAYKEYMMHVMISQTIYKTGASVGMNLLRGGSKALINLLW